MKLVKIKSAVWTIMYHKIHNTKLIQNSLVYMKVGFPDILPSLLDVFLPRPSVEHSDEFVRDIWLLFFLYTICWEDKMLEVGNTIIHDYS